MNTQTKLPTGEPTIVMTRVYDAPRDLVWRAMTEAKHVRQWWGGPGISNPVCEMDVRPGGLWRRRMRSPSGDVILKHGVYREIIAPERLVFTYITENAAGVIDPETLVSVIFADLGGGRTRLTLRHTAFETEISRDDHRGGWIGCLERFVGFIEKV